MPSPQFLAAISAALNAGESIYDAANRAHSLYHGVKSLWPAKRSKYFRSVVRPSMRGNVGLMYRYKFFRKRARYRNFRVRPFKW